MNRGRTSWKAASRPARRLLLLVLILLIAAACGGGGGGGGGGGSTPGKIIIGYAAAVTGALAAYDSPDGVQCAIDDINKNGGILGRQVQLIVKDIKSDPAVAATVGQELLDAGAVVILAPPTDDTSIPIAQLAKPKNIPVLSVEATQPSFPLASPENGYLVYYGDNTSAAAVAEYAYKQGVRSTYLMTSPDLGSYALLNPKWFGETIEHYGGKVVGSGSWKLGAGDFSTQITKIQALKPPPDSIYFAGAVPDNAQFVRQLRAAGVTVPVYGGDGTDDPDFVKVAGKASEGMTFSAPGFPGAGTPLKQWIDDCKSRGYKIRNTGNAAAGDAMAIVKAAIEKAGSAEPAKINDAIKGLENVKGVLSSSITYKGTPNVPQKDLLIVQIKNGEPQPAQNLKPSWVPEPTS
jgi:branched-chain amino acid transport system substrate-binding protein